MKTVLKSAMLFFALILTSSLGFASENTPEVYVSQAPLSDLSGPELLDTNWFWVLIIVVLVVGLLALVSAKDEEHENHVPEHVL